MQANSIIADPAQTTISWIDAGTGSAAYLGKAYSATSDSNPAVEISLVESGTYQVKFNAYDLADTSFDGTLHEAKAYAEATLHENGNLDFSVTGPATLTALNEDGTTLAFVVKSTNPWTFTSSVAWATADVNSGSAGATVTVTIADNAGAARTGTLTFSNGAVTKTFAIGQAINA